MIGSNRATSLDIWLIGLKNLDEDGQAIRLDDAARMSVAAEQQEFVGDPLRMMLVGLEEDTRHPYVIESGGVPVGVLTLQSGAARMAGWPHDDSAMLLRGFLIDTRSQGLGLGSLAAAAAVEEGRRLAARLGGGESGVVLSVNERNPAAQAAYAKAGFVDSGRYLGGRSGPQRIMYRSFNLPSTKVDDAHVVNYG
ncbi:GNAT family N-acetyltransferase [Paenarthrobacter sp. S56]|uniref:GNAT family N-acetyltransferase n=1 Tax=Paenarthrobacter sp. S56 TaxID=3138179 RepID=UPI00321A422B